MTGEVPIELEVPDMKEGVPDQVKEEEDSQEEEGRIQEKQEEHRGERMGTEGTGGVGTRKKNVRVTKRNEKEED